VLMVQKIWTQEKETDKEFTTKYDERLYLMPGLDAACKKAIEDEIKAQNSSNSGKQFGIKYDDALKKRAEILKSKFLPLLVFFTNKPRSQDLNEILFKFTKWNL
jgi:hypothetical protein